MTAAEEFAEEDKRVGYWNRMGVFQEGWPPEDLDEPYIPSSALSIAIHDKAFAEAEAERRNSQAQKKFPKTGDVLGG